MQLYNFASLKVVFFPAAQAGVMQASCPQSGVRRWIWVQYSVRKQGLTWPHPVPIWTPTCIIGIPVGTYSGVGYISKKIRFIVWKHQAPFFPRFSNVG